MKDSGLKIVSCTEKGEDSLFETDLSGPVCLIMGSEEDGVSGEYLKRSDHRCFIPMAGHTSSLNVSVASGIFLAEVCRNR
jgi:23S rRNA (guanosine2251-2'-O)-methyltransferase